MDFLTLHMLHTLVSNSLSDLSGILEMHMLYMPGDVQLEGEDVSEVFEIERPIKPLFRLELLIEPGRMYFDPNEDLTVEMFENILTEWDEIIYRIEPFEKDPAFNPFIT